MSEVKRYEPCWVFSSEDVVSDISVRECKDGEFVKFIDVEKALKLWEMMKPQSTTCVLCQHYKGGKAYCQLFGEKDSHSRCAECVDIFGGDV